MALGFDLVVLWWLCIWLTGGLRCLFWVVVVLLGLRVGWFGFDVGLV